MFNHENLWLVFFWGIVAVLCGAEVIWPNNIDHADRSNRWTVNFGFGILNGLITSLAPPLTVFSAIWAQSHRFGALNNFDCPLWFKILTTVISLSFAQYAFHRSAHIIPILWRVHRVHHGDFHLDASSAFRFHPVEVIGAIVFTIPFVVIIGLPPAAVAAYELVEIVLSLLLHANIRIPEAIERAARFLFVTPVLHRFHHSAEQAQTDSNYGNVFSIWDRLLRTYHDAAPGSGKPEKFGLDDMSLAQARDFMAQLRLVSRPEVAARPRSIKSVTID